METSQYVVSYISFGKLANTRFTQVKHFSVLCSYIHTFYNTAQA